MLAARACNVITVFGHDVLATPSACKHMAYAARVLKAYEHMLLMLDEHMPICLEHMSIC
jgi:hypothetical protein